MNPNETFKVTRVGCGLAGWSDEVVAPMFKDAPVNCLFDSAWDEPVLLPGRTYWGTFGDFPAPSMALVEALKHPTLIDSALVGEP